MIFAQRLFGILFLFLSMSASAVLGDTPGPGFSKAFAPSTIAPGGTSTLTFAIDNSDHALAVTDLAFTDSLPTGMTIAPVPNLNGTCSFRTLTAPAGGSTITASEGSVGGFNTCTLSVDVTATDTGTNLSGDLTSSAGNSGTATATLTVSATQASFTKEFAPSSVSLNDISTLTFTITIPEGGLAAESASFSDILPTGMTVAPVPNASSTCGSALDPPTVTAVAGSNSIAFSHVGVLPSNPTVAEAASCTVSVDVLAGGVGALDNTSSPLQLTHGFGNPDQVVAGASATLTVASLPPGTVSLTKTFVSDPVGPGQTATLNFSIYNTDTVNVATGIAFTDDLDGMLTGATLDSVNSNTCGGSLTGTDTLSLSGASLPAPGSCDISVEVQIPGGATAGSYPNTTSSITATLDSGAVIGSPASDTLEVRAFAPLVFSKSFTGATPGGTTTVTFDLSNPNAAGGDATDVAFSNQFADILGDAFSIVVPPAAGTVNTCGGTLSPSLFPPDQLGVAYTGGSLAAGASCSVSAILGVPAGLTPGSYPNTSFEQTATIGAETLSGGTATASLNITGDFGLNLTKTFLSALAAPGSDVDVALQISNPSEDIDATLISFTDDLELFHSGAVLTALGTDSCGGTATGIGTGTLGYSGGAVSAGLSCTINATITLGAATGLATNTIGDLTASQNGAPAALVPGSGGSDDITVTTALPVTLAKSFTNDPVIAGDSVNLEFTLNNPGASDATAIMFTDSLNSVIPTMTGTGLPISACGGTMSGLSGDTFLSFAGGSLLAGETCTFSVTVQVPAAPSGSYNNVTSLVSATVGGTPVVGAAASDFLVVDNDALSVTKAFTSGPVLLGGIASLQLTIENLSAATVTSVALSDDLEAMLTGATGTITGNTCGATSAGAGTGNVSISGGTIEGASQCSVDIDVAVPGGATPGFYPNTTSLPTGLVGALPVTGNAGSDTLQVIAAPLPVVTKVISPDILAPGDQTVMTLTISNPAAGAALADLALNDDLTAVLAGLSASSVGTSGACGASAVAGGTTLVTLSGASLDPGDICTLTATLDVPVGASPGDYTNTTSPLTALGVTIAGGASDSFTVVPVPAFSKLFTPDNVNEGEGSTLSFDIDNGGAGVVASALAFIDNFPPGIQVAAPPNVTNTCGGAFTAAAGATGVSLTGGTAGAFGTCAISVDVVTTGAGILVNLTEDLTSSIGNSGPATDTLTVLAAPAPVFTKVFAPDTIFQAGISTLTFTIDNSAASIEATTLAFTDNFPGGMEVAAIPNATNSCGGTFLAGAGSNRVSLSGGTVAALTDCTLSVDITALSVANYANVTEDLTSSLGNSGPASASLQVDAQPNGTVTIVQITDTDGTYGFSSPTPALTFNIATAGGLGQQGPISLTGGTHVVTQTNPAGIGTSEITCTDADSTGDPTTGILTINITALETITCTFISQETSQKTVDTINTFLTRRTDLILTNRPNPNRRIDRLNRGTGTERLAYNPGDLAGMVPFTFDPRSIGTGNYRFATSLAQVTRSVGVMSLAGSSGGDVAYVNNNAFDIWFEGSYSRFAGTGDSGGYFGIAYLGADYLISPDVLVGALVQFDVMRDASTALSYTTQGQGLMAGPYMTARLAQNLFLDARMAWGKSWNTVSPFNTYTDNFNTTRFLADASLSGDFTSGIWTFRPNVSLSFMEETQAAYIDSLSVLIPSQSVSRGQVRIGPNISTRFMGDNGTYYEPHFTLDAIYSLDNTTGPPITLPAGPPDGWRARLEGGVRMTTEGGARVSFGGHYDGIGLPGFSSWGAKVELEFSF